MSAKFELTAEQRTAKGSSASRRLRAAGKVPAVMYGAERDPVMLALNHDDMLHNLQNEAFHTSILTVKVGDGIDQAILRDYQMHPFKPQVLHIDFQRISATEKIHMPVPLHFVGQDVAPGVKQQGGIVSHLMTEVDVTCLPHQLPEFLTADVSQLHVGESVHLSDLGLPEGVQITTLAHGGDDLAIATVAAVRAAEEEAAPEAEAVPAVAEAEAAKQAEAKKEGK